MSGYRNESGVGAFFQKEFSDPKKRKRLLIIAVVLIVIVIGIVRSATSAEAAKGDVIVSGEEAVVIADTETATVAGTESTEASAQANTDGATTETPGESTQGTANSGYVFVDVGGAVNNGGVIALPAGSRIADAITAAGGLRDDADVRYLNRAALLADGDRLYVPTEAEVLSGATPPSAGQVTSSGGYTGATQGDASGGTASGSAGSSNGLININTADSDALQILNGVGPATAQKIIDYRTSNGGFKSIEDIMNVSGIGQATFNKLKDHITI